MTQRSLLILLLIGTLLASCAPSSPGTLTPDINTMVAANAQTMVAALFQTQTALAPSATNTALPTATALPTSTALTTLLLTPTLQQPVYIAASPTPTGPTPTPLASSLAVGCNNLELLNSYTDPEGPFLPGQDFTQYWKVKNNGTCDWLYLYSLEFASGTKLGEATSVRFSKKISPNNTTTLSILLHAPNKSGTYKASWRFTDGGGKAFGAVLPVSITVGGPTNTPKPPAATPNLQQTADAANTALSAQQTAIAQQATAAAAALTAQSVQQTASAVAATQTACAATQAVGGTCP